MTTGLRQRETAPRASAAPMRVSAAPMRVRRAEIVLFWERLWPALLPALAPVFALAILSLFAVWRVLPAWTHAAALIAALGASGFAFYRLYRTVRWPGRREALARLEEGGWLAHQPLQTIEDRPFAADETSPLWQAHLQEMRDNASRARLRGPYATADRTDPYALRYAAPGLLAVALVAAGPEWGDRLALTLRPGAAQPAASAVADLWIEPPAYTGKAPIHLLRAGEPLAGAREQVNAPQGSVVVAQVNDARRGALTLRTRTEKLTAKTGGDAGGRATLALGESGLLRLSIAGADGRWPIGVIPDRPPTADFIETPAATDDARLAIAVLMDDDYALAKGALRMRLDPDQPRPFDAPALDEASVREIRTVTIDGLAGAPGERRFDLDLQSDPWAGLVVRLQLVVTDGAGQTGRTEELSVRLPERPFFNPLAKAVIEQRQTLAVAPGDWRRAGRSLDALTLAPEYFYDRSRDYLLMRTAFWRVMRDGDGAAKEEGFTKTVADFWPLALQLEDEALELARQRLEAAQEALMQALENGAGDEEIERLVEELRAALQQYLQALAQSGMPMAEGGQQDGEAITDGDLNDMLDAIRNMAQSGARNAARQALSELEQLLNNLQMSARGQGQGMGGEGQGQSGQSQGGAAGEAGDLIGRQRDLANRSFERGQEFGAEGDDLAGEQGGLAGDLEALLDQLGESGGRDDPEGEGAAALREALRNMRDAEGALGRDDFGGAGEAMENAIANLRDGAESLAQAQAGQQGQEMIGAGEGEATGPAVDPLGRPVGNAYGRGVDVPEKSDAQRAREVLEELRRRLSDGERSEDEVDYLERLLDWF